VSKEKQDDTNRFIISAEPLDEDFDIKVLRTIFTGKEKTKNKKVHPAELNTGYFPLELKNAKTENEFLKKYIESRQPIYLFEAIRNDVTVLQDQIVIETIKEWKSFANSIFPLMDFITTDEIPVEDYQYLLERIGKCLVNKPVRSMLSLPCVIGLGLVHVVPEFNIKGRPKLDLDRMYAKNMNPKKVVHPFVSFWNLMEKSIMEIRPKNKKGRMKIYRGKYDSHKIKDYRKPLSRLLYKEISDEELKWFEWSDIKTITSSVIAYYLKEHCQMCRRLKARNHWNRIHELYLEAIDLGLFALPSVQK